MEKKKVNFDSNTKSHLEFIEDAQYKDEIASVKLNAGTVLESFVNGNRKLKTVWRNCPYQKDIQVGDVSCYDRNREDSTFLYNKDIMLRIRRGTTLVKSAGENPQNPEVKILRKGLTKFFYLRESHQLFGEGRLKSENEMLSKHGQDEVEEDLLILDKVYLNLQKSESISVYQTGKANGECAHVSFVKFGSKEHYWSCSSKNVTIL